MTVAYLTTNPYEEGVLVITLAWKDETGAAVIPTSATWSLTDPYGTIINNRSEVTIANLSTTNTIVLAGNDLQYSISGVHGNVRELVVEFVYDSNAGTNLSGKEARRFKVIALAKVS